MSEQEEAADHENDGVDEPEPVSMRDLEMIFAPGKPPPMRRDAEATKLADAEAKKEPPKPPRPPRKAASPPDIGAGDLAAFAAMGSVPPPAPEPAEKREALTPAAPQARSSDTPPPSEGRRRARVVPKLRKPMAISFGDTPAPAPVAKPQPKEDWDAPPDARLQDLRELASSHPPPKAGVTLDPDDVLSMRNDALDDALQAPHVPPDLARMVEGGGNGKVHEHAPPPRPKNKSNSDAVTSAVTAPPSEPGKKRKKGPSSKRPKSSSVAPESASVRPSKAPGKESRPPVAAPAKEQKASRAPLYAILAAALLGGGYLLMRGPGTPSEPPKREQAAVPTATPTPPPTQETKPAQATPPPETAAPVESSAPVATATASAPTLFGKLPPPGETAQPAPSVASTGAPAPSATATAKPAEGGGGGGFDKASAMAALGGAVGQASGCKQSGDPSGVAHVQVTFAPSGRVTVANVSGPPFAGTATGGCIARAFKTASVPPFDGDPVTVSKTVEIP